MADDIKQTAKGKGLKSLFQKLEKPLRTGASSAARDAGIDIKKQKMKETAKVAEAESEIATKKALMKGGKGGRQSLIKSSGSGLSANLGGTV